MKGSFGFLAAWLAGRGTRSTSRRSSRLCPHSFAEAMARAGELGFAFAALPWRLVTARPLTRMVPGRDCGPGFGRAARSKPASYPFVSQSIGTWSINATA